MKDERTLILIKPDGVTRGLIGEILGRFERKGMRLVGLKMIRFTEKMAENHYAEHIDKEFFPRLKAFIMSGPVVAAVVAGPDAIELVRVLMGDKDPHTVQPGTIRGDFANTTTANLIHGSDSVSRAEEEIGLYFTEDEIFDYS